MFIILNNSIQNKWIIRYNIINYILVIKKLKTTISQSYLIKMNKLIMTYQRKDKNYKIDIKHIDSFDYDYFASI